MRIGNERDLVHDLVLPTMLFAALGGMSWAVRGTTGYGGSMGCIFAGVLWGIAWWFISRDEGTEPGRRYASGWIVLAMTIGVGMSGARGWMQWPTFFEGKLQTNWAEQEFEPIARWYGFVWLFIAGMPWAGIGACMLAWCGSLRSTRAWHWAIRIACGVGGAMLARFLFDHHPELFLPLYDSLAERYPAAWDNAKTSDPNLHRLINDSGSAIVHMGIYLGLLAYEIGRRDWKNVLLIVTVGVVNGAGWALLQNWKWAPGMWPSAGPNWWRCWESSGGISIGIAYGVAYFLVNRRMSDRELAVVRKRRAISGPNPEWLIVWLGITGTLAVLMLDEVSLWGQLLLGVLVVFGIVYFLTRRGPYYAQPAPPSEAYGDPNLERLGLYLGLLLGLGFSIRNGLKGWGKIYYGDEDYWSELSWQIMGPVLLVCLVAICGWILLRPLARNFSGDIFPRAAGLVWLALIVQNILAQLVTGPPSEWHEFTFSIYYVLLLGISGAIVIHYTYRQAMLRLPQRIGF